MGGNSSKVEWVKSELTVSKRDASSWNDPINVTSTQTQTEQWTTETLREHYMPSDLQSSVSMEMRNKEAEEKSFREELASLTLSCRPFIQSCKSDINGSGDAWKEYDAAIQSFWDLNLQEIKGLTPITFNDSLMLNMGETSKDTISKQEFHSFSNAMIPNDVPLNKPRSSIISRSEMKGNLEYSTSPPTVIRKIRQAKAMGTIAKSGKRSANCNAVPTKNYVDIVNGKLVNAPFTTHLHPIEYTMFVDISDSAIREFFDSTDRRLFSVCNKVNCRLYFHPQKTGQLPYMYKGFQTIPVIITAPKYADIKKCVRLIYSKYPNFQAATHHPNPNEFKSLT